MIIKHVVCVQIRGDGAQCFESMDPNTPPHLETVWLTGFQRHPTVKLHDRGTMSYVGTGSMGFWTFNKEAK